MKKYIHLLLLIVMLSSCHTDAQDYPAIYESPKSINFEIVQLVNGAIRSNIYYDTAGNNILFLAGDDREVFLYKVNGITAEKDSIHYSYGSEPWNSSIKGTTIFRDSTYLDWIESGSKERKNFRSVYNRIQNADQAIWNSLFKEKYNKATEVYFKLGYDGGDMLMHCYFNINGDWHLMYPNKDDERLMMRSQNVETKGFDAYVPKHKQLLHIESLYDTDYNENKNFNTMDWNKGSDTIKITKFIKKEKETVSGQVLWHGIAFYDFKYQNENLNFKLNTDLTSPESVYQGFINFYYPKTLPFALLEVSENYYIGANDTVSKEMHRDGLGLYLIKKR